MTTGTQFEQLQMFATPAEISGWNSGDRESRTMAEHVPHMDAGRIKALSVLVDADGGIDEPVELYHGPSGKTLGSGHYRAAVAMTTDRLVPVVHTHQYW